MTVDEGAEDCSGHNFNQGFVWGGLKLVSHKFKWKH